MCLTDSGISSILIQRRARIQEDRSTQSTFDLTLIKRHHFTLALAQFTSVYTENGSWESWDPKKENFISRCVYGCAMKMIQYCDQFNQNHRLQYISTYTTDYNSSDLVYDPRGVSLLKVITLDEHAFQLRLLSLDRSVQREAMVHYISQ